MQLPHDLKAEPRAGLADGGLACDLDRNGGIAQPLQAFHKAAQHLPAGRVHVERQRNDVIDHHMRRQVALADAALARRCQHSADPSQGEGLGDHAKAHIVGDPAALGKRCHGACHVIRLLRKSSDRRRDHR